mmetsp:Transcript_21242/g.39968  ORF Transcript_21242/g.39968 Transcript_21242/m.39968 type:complete len:230 (+) Transcript_21242:56-745(+)
MKRTSGAAYLAERDKTDQRTSSKQLKPNWKGVGFGDFLRDAPRKPLFESLLESEFAGGRVLAKVTADDAGANTGIVPKCSWWQFREEGQPIIAEDASLDLAKLKDVPLVALIAQVASKETINDASSNQGYTVAKSQSAWTAKVYAGSQDLVRIRRPEGLRSTGVWLVATFQKEGDAWKATAADELYPEHRLEAVLRLRFKDFINDKSEKKEDAEDPMAATRRLLEEAMA